MTRKNKAQDPRQCWETPPDAWAALYGQSRFELDVAATALTARCEDYISPEEDALGVGMKWSRPRVMLYTSIFCNPGFGNILPWIKRAYETVQLTTWNMQVVVLGLEAPSTAWYSWAEKHASEIRRMRPRIQYIPAPGVKPSSNARESTAFYFRRVPPSWPGAKVWTWNWLNDLKNNPGAFGMTGETVQAARDESRRLRNERLRQWKEAQT